MSDLVAGDIGVIADPSTSASGLTCAPWATSGDICDPCIDNTDVEDVLDTSLQVASDILFLLSGRRWPGTCEATIRPCARPVCGSGYGCSCSGLSVIKLGPDLQAVSQVKLDGTVLVEGTDYRVDTYEDELVKLRANGKNAWPCCQRMDLPDTEQQTFSVAYTYGTAPPAGGVRAAADLACQLALACSGGKCALPKETVQSITRQGITIAMVDRSQLFAKGLTGLSDVDLWLTSVNPNGLSRRARVISPDTMQHARRV